MWWWYCRKKEKERKGIGDHTVNLLIMRINKFVYWFETSLYTSKAPLPVHICNSLYGKWWVGFVVVSLEIQTPFHTGSESHVQSSSQLHLKPSWRPNQKTEEGSSVSKVLRHLSLGLVYSPLEDPKCFFFIQEKTYPINGYVGSFLNWPIWDWDVLDWWLITSFADHQVILAGVEINTNNRTLSTIISHFNNTSRHWPLG